MDAPKLDVLDLFCGLKGWSAPAIERGHRVVTNDIEAVFEPDICKDILEVSADEIREHFGGRNPDIILASPPCEGFSVARISYNWHGYSQCRKCAGQIERVTGEKWIHLEDRYEILYEDGRMVTCESEDHAPTPVGDPTLFPKTDKAMLSIRLVEKTLQLIEELEPRWWLMENPTAAMRKTAIVQDLSLHPVTYCQFGETFRKPTDLWGDLPPSLVLPGPCTGHPRNGKVEMPNGMTFVLDKQGNPCHESASRGAKTGVQGLANAAERGKIPYELALAVIKAAEQDFGSSLPTPTSPKPAPRTSDVDDAMLVY